MDKNLKTQKVEKAVECDATGKVAIDYGFDLIVPPNVTHSDISKAKAFSNFDKYKDACEKVAMIQWYLDNNLHTEPQPIIVSYEKPMRGTGRKKPSEVSYGFEVMGSIKSTGEAIVIKVALAILSDFGYKNLILKINSIGDRESISRYDREIASYYRKNAHLLSAKMRSEFKKSPQNVLGGDSPETESFRHSAPDTVTSLSDLSRAHFKEVLEFVEAFGVEYEIDPNLQSNKLYGGYTVFEIHDKNGRKNSAPLCFGYRYNYLAKKIGAKKDIACVGMSISLRKKSSMSKKVLIKNIKKPKFYLVQLGTTAKLKALNLIEILRKNNISVYHSIPKDKISGQLSGAEYMNATHVLIFGQKEAIENSAVIRNLNTRVQETLTISNLPVFLKKLMKEKK